MNALLRNSICLLLAGILIASCDTGCLTETFRNFPQACWHKDSMATLVAPINDTLSRCAIVITLRINDMYPYSNIILSVTTTSPSGIIACDTVEYRLTDEAGRWTGKTGGQWVDNRLAFREEVRFTGLGDYTFAIAHLMRKEELPGVGTAGVRIEKTR